MKRWLTKPLGELLKVQNGFAFKSELFNEDGKGLPIIRIRDLARGYSETFYDGEHESAFEVENGDFLIGMDGEFRCYRWKGNKALLNQRVCRLQNFSSDLNAGYVFYGINDHLRQIEDNTSFVTVKHLSSKQIASIKMPMPPLAEQERIVKLLDEADELRKLRAQADRRAAALIPALFHEMFGDPTAHLRGWPSFRLDAIGKIQTGTTPPTGSPEFYNGDIPFVRPAELGDCQPVTKSEKYLTQAGVAVGRSVRKGATLVGCIGNVGKTGIAGTRVAFNQQINAVEFSEKVDDDYGFICCSLLAPVFQARAAQALLPILNKTRFSEIEIPVPPLALQKKFAARVTEIRELEAAQAASRQRVEHLFQSMLHRAFNQAL